MAFLVLSLMLALGVQGQDFTYTTNNGAITITKYTGPSGDVTIPNSITGLPVTSIGSYAFQYQALTNITIPDSVTNVGDGAFYFSGLASVTVPNSVINLGNGAFTFCTNLRSAVIPDSVTNVGDAMFLGCTELMSVTMGNGITNIGYRAFDGCTNLTNVSIPKNVTSIGIQAFYGCSSLTNVAIGDSVTNIGNSAFFNCTSLTKVTIPSSVTNIGFEAFLYCSSLRSITVDGQNANYSSLDGVLFDRGQSTILQVPEAKVGSYIIPDTVTNIGVEAFRNCMSLTNVTIGKRVSDILENAFYSCSNLTSLTIPETVASIGSWAFAFCAGLTSVTIPASVTNIEGYAFHYCSGLNGVFFKGNAPAAGSFLFVADYNATVYYLEGTTGWGQTFGGLVTQLWNPRMLTSDANFGVHTNNFGFDIVGTVGIPLVIEVCTSLVARSWVPLRSCTLTNGFLYFSDPQWTSFPGHYYRIRSL